MSTIKYYYLIMSQKSLLQNQVIEEILRERSTYYSITNKKTDFWLLISPNFVYDNSIIDKIRLSNFYKKNNSDIIPNELNSKKNLEFFGSIISTDKDFIKWISLRIGYFEEIDQIPYLNSFNFVSDGIFGILEINKNKENINSPLFSNSNYLHPSILIDRYKKSLELYFSEQKNVVTV